MEGREKEAETEMKKTVGEKKKPARGKKTGGLGIRQKKRKRGLGEAQLRGSRKRQRGTSLVAGKKLNW